MMLKHRSFVPDTIFVPKDLSPNLSVSEYAIGDQREVLAGTEVCTSGSDDYYG